MEQKNNNKKQKNRNNNNHQKASNNKKPVQKAAATKERKGSRVKQQPISGFSTLSQVSGAPLLRSHKSNIPVPAVKSVVEPKCVCPICGEPIEVIAEAFTNPNGEYVHFDCVLNDIKSREVLEESQTISYLGSGSFGVCQKGEDGKYTIVKRIEYENNNSFNAMKTYVESLKN
ncbi:MAG: hypothetical protein KBS81_00360 [Spirochaetales bacterium]|nr:hypothetical protein [Candidatus Physcosoma equi]